MGLISRTPSPEPEQSARELEKELKEMRVSFYGHPATHTLAHGAF